MTRQRALILEILRSDMCHHTAQEIYELAKAKLPTISLATVYNNLHALEEEKFIRKISGDDGVDRYDNSHIPHGHLVCCCCGRIIDVNIPHFDEELAELVGEDVESYELKVRARCPSCKSKTVDEQLSIS